MNAPLVELAVKSLRGWADPSDRADAEPVLASWRYYRRLSTEDVAAVLDHFGPERDLVAGTDFLFDANLITAAALSGDAEAVL